MYKIIDEYIELLIKKSTPERPYWNIEGAKGILGGKWNYVDGCMLISLIDQYYETKNRKYLDFVKSFVDFYVFEDGTIKGYDIYDYNIDDICESRILFDLYNEFKEEKYLKALKMTYLHVIRHPRTKEGSLWHKRIYPHQVWLDGLFMAQPFYARYEAVYNNKKNYKDILNQFKNVRLFMFDPKYKLYYHGFDSSKSAFWCDKETGLSKNFWLRAMGWYLVSIVDVISYYEDDNIKKDFFYPLLKEAIDGLLQYQDKKSKMFYQIINSDDNRNYLETSGSSLTCFTILKGVRIGALPKEYLQIGLDLFDGICKHSLREVNGELNLTDICLVAGLGPDNNLRRDGTLDYYFSEPIVNNDAKGVGPFIMAYTEILKLKKQK